MSNISQFRSECCSGYLLGLCLHVTGVKCLKCAWILKSVEVTHVKIESDAGIDTDTSRKILLGLLLNVEINIFYMWQAYCLDCDMAWWDCYWHK